MDDLIGRIDAVLDDDESLDDWAYPWTDSWRSWGSTAPWDLGESDDDEPLDGGWDYYPPAQIHVIPAHRVSEWLACLDTMPTVERDDIDWYVVCFQCLAVGERSVNCGCEPAR